ncbi:MAG TPA: histidine kinase, partial [Allosphingosinicella sp.]|nr:histidine kinase [Allosphingosinicella sp.]
MAIEVNQALRDGREDEPRLTDSSGIRLSPTGFSTNGIGASASDAGGQGVLNASELPDDMDFQPRTFLARRLPDLGIALKSILAFWLFYMVLNTLRAAVMQFPGFWEMIERRALATIFGAAITFLVYLAVRPLAEASLRKKATVAGLVCLPASLVFASFNFYIFYVFSPLPSLIKEPKHDMTPLEHAVRSIIESGLSWYFLFAAWSALYVAMSYAAQLRAADRRAAGFAREAQEAQLRALRYQINPHFLFNTLNSLSSLILSQKTDVAERMIMNLSTFFRTTLSADPTADVSLEEEIKLQRLYLDIEHIRF